MSFEAQSAVEFLQLNNNAATMLVTAIVYDHLLVFSGEVDYIWCRPWTWVSTLFVLIRYFGLGYVVAYGFLNSVFSPGSMAVSFGVNQVAQWSFELFFAAADLVMVLRVYAMWSRSKTILSVLLFIYVPRIMISFVFSCIFNGSNTYLSVSVVQIFHASYCVFSYNMPSPIWLYMIPHSVLSAALLILVVVQALKQSFDMYKVTKKWQPNRYMMLFAREGIIYVLIRALFDIVNVLNGTLSPFNIPELLLNVLVRIPLFSMLPRFIIGMRELYDRDLNRRQQQHTGFGGLSKPITGESTVVMSTIAFADIAPGQGQIVEGDVDDSEMLQSELMVGKGAPQV